MSGLDPFFRLVGHWHATNRLWLPPAKEPYEAPTSAVVTSIVGGKFIQLTYTWAFDGEAQEGVMLIGYESSEQAATVVWADSWHMGNKFMLCQGEIHVGHVVVRGSFAAESGPDWGWRIELEAGDTTLDLRMYIVKPDGAEMMAVEALYTRVE